MQGVMPLADAARRLDVSCGKRPAALPPAHGASPRLSGHTFGGRNGAIEPAEPRAMAAFAHPSQSGRTEKDEARTTLLAHLPPLGLLRHRQFSIRATEPTSPLDCDAHR